MPDFNTKDLSTLRNEIAFEAAMNYIRSGNCLNNCAPIKNRLDDIVSFGFGFADEFMEKAGLEEMI